MDRDIQEIKDRCRRMETRLTKFLESQGFETQVKPPVWNDAGVVLVPSISIALKDIIEAVPDYWDRSAMITVIHRGDVLITFYLTPDRKD